MFYSAGQEGRRIFSISEPTAGDTLPSPIPFPFPILLLLLFDNSVYHQGIYYSLNINSVPTSGSVPVVEDGRTPTEPRGLRTYDALSCSECLPCFSLFSLHNDTPGRALSLPSRDTQGPARFKCPAQAYTSSKLCSQYPTQEFMTFPWLSPASLTSACDSIRHVILNRRGRCSKSCC